MKPRFNYFFLLILLAGCEKEAEIAYPAPILTGKSFVKTSEILVYSGGKRLYDPEKITRFLSADPAWEDIAEYDDQNKTLQFIRSDSAVLDGKVEVSVSYHNGRFILKHTTEYVGLFFGHERMNEIWKYPPQTETVPYPSGFYTVYYPVYVGIGNPLNCRLLVTIVKLYRTHGDEGNYSIYYARVSNEIAPNLINTLSERDTLAMQSFELPFSQ